MRRFLPLLASFLLLAPYAAVCAEDLSNIKWETNETDPPFGDPAAKKGGTFNTFTTAYPLTLRLVGPNANDSFAGYNRAFSQDFTLVVRHPNTDNFIPWMATHWSVQDDKKTVYYKLDPDARWSDGKPITADDYVCTWETIKNEHIVDPFYNQYARDYFTSVEKIDDYTIKIVGTNPSWRPLSDYTLWATPKHVTNIFDGWAKDEKVNLTPQVVPGPYVVSEMATGERVVFSKVPNWWGEKKHYMQGLFNPEKIVLKVIADEDRAFDYFKKGDLSFYTVNTAKKWANEMDFEALKKGWVHRRREFVDAPQGMYGFAMNLEFPLFQNKDFRKGLQYLFNFKELNEKQMAGAYYRQNSAFEGTEYMNPNVKAYPFDPKLGRDHLAKAGFSKRGPDGILVNDKGQRASFTLTYGSKGLEPHMTIVQQLYKRFGVDMQLSLREPAAAFELGLERKYEMTIISRTSGFYPEPRQYFHSEFKKTTNNNAIFGFENKEVDELIEVFRWDQDRDKRVKAMNRIDEIINDEAFYMPLWFGPYIRFVYWDHVQFPKNYFPKRTQQYTDYWVFWIDEDREKALQAAMAAGKSLGEDPVVDIDPYGVKSRLEAAAASGEAAPATGDGNKTE